MKQEISNIIKQIFNESGYELNEINIAKPPNLGIGFLCIFLFYWLFNLFTFF